MDNALASFPRYRALFHGQGTEGCLKMGTGHAGTTARHASTTHHVGYILVGAVCVHMRREVCIEYIFDYWRILKQELC